MSRVYELAMAGRPMETPFVDVHGHFGSWTETVIPYAYDYGRNIAEMDRYGCDMVWMTAARPGYGDDMRLKNDYVFDFADAYPDRIIPYCTLSVNHPGRMLSELKRCMGRGRCVGVKMHRYSQPAYTVKTDFMQPVLEVLNEHKLVYLNHSFENLPDLFWALERYPDITFINGHFWGPMHVHAMRYPNLRICTCAAYRPDEVGNECRCTGRADTFLVGSDFSLFQLGFGLGMIAYADMPEPQKRDILGLNAIRLMQRMKWFTPGIIRKEFAL